MDEQNLDEQKPSNDAALDRRTFLSTTAKAAAGVAGAGALLAANPAGAWPSTSGCAASTCCAKRGRQYHLHSARQPGRSGHLEQRQQAVPRQAPQHQCHRAGRVDHHLERVLRQDADPGRRRQGARHHRHRHRGRPVDRRQGSGAAARRPDQARPGGAWRLLQRHQPQAARAVQVQGQDPGAALLLEQHGDLLQHQDVQEAGHPDARPPTGPATISSAPPRRCRPAAPTATTSGRPAPSASSAGCTRRAAACSIPP